MSERGPKGDHGQHGDPGDTGLTGERGWQGATGDDGATGERGAHGDTGQSGETGATGPRGPTNWQSYVAMGVAGIVAFAVFGARLNDKPSKAQTAKIERLARENTARIADIAREGKRIEREGAERRDQTCRVFEGDHLNDVNQLKKTYKFLSRPQPPALRAFIPLTVQSLPALEKKARKDPAPDYCDQPGVKAETLWKASHHKRGAPPIGNPEPDPVLPKRRDFSYLLKR